MQSNVCILAPDHAEALEERGVIPDCRYHMHMSHREADRAIAAERAPDTKFLVEGWGQARTVRSIDGKRRITPIATILTYASQLSDGSAVLQAVMAELH